MTDIESIVRAHTGVVDRSRLALEEAREQVERARSRLVDDIATAVRATFANAAPGGTDLRVSYHEHDDYWSARYTDADGRSTSCFEVSALLGRLVGGGDEADEADLRRGVLDALAGRS